MECIIWRVIFLVLLNTSCEKLVRNYLNFEIKQALFTRGASIEARTVRGSTSLILASYNGHLPVVEVSYPFQIHSIWHLSGTDWFFCSQASEFIEDYSKIANWGCVADSAQTWRKHWSKKWIRTHISDDFLGRWPFVCGRGTLFISNTQYMIFFGTRQFGYMEI